MPLEVNSLMSFLERVNEAQHRRQMEAQEQAPATPEMPEWSRRLNPDDFGGKTREMLLKAQSAAPLAGGAGSDQLMGGPAGDGIHIGEPDAAIRDGIGRVMDEEQQRQQPPRPMPKPALPMQREAGTGLLATQQPPQRQMPEPAAQMPQQQNAAPAAPQGGQPVNLRKALGPHVGGPGDFVAMAQRARQTGEMPGGGRAPVSGSGGSDTLAGGPTPARGGGMFGGSGPGLGYMIGGIGSLLQEASGQTGAASRFAEVHGGQFRERAEANQTRQLALTLGIPEDIAATAPIDILKPIIGDAYKRSVQGNQPQWEYKDGQWYRIDDQGPTPFGEPNTSAGTPKLATFQQGEDGPVRTVDMGSPAGRAEAQQLMADGWVERSKEGIVVNNNMAGDQTPGRKKADEAFAPEHASWISGGFADVQTQIKQLDEVAAALERGAELSGPIIGAAYQRMPKEAFAAAYPEAQAALDNVSEVIQRSLRETLGAQMAEQEAERFIARAYNISLPPAENAKRVRRAVDKLKLAARAKDATVRYFDEHGTLTGFDYRTVPLADEDEAPKPEQGQADAPPPGVDPEDWKYMTPEQRALWQ